MGSFHRWHRCARSSQSVSTTTVSLAAVVLGAACAQSSSSPSGSFGSAPDGESVTATSSGTSSGSSGAGSYGDDAEADAGRNDATSSSGDTAPDGGSGSSGMGTSTGSSGASGSSASSGSGGATASGSGSGGSSGSSVDGSTGKADAGSDGAGAANSCTSADAVCHASNSGCNVGSYYLYDNQWNCGSSSNCGSGPCHCGPESAYGCTNPNGTVGFVVTSEQPAGNTAVLSYPAMQDNFSSNPLLSSFTEITATFEETSPHVGDYEVAWDCWFNNQANELMIWVDNYNQTPGGNKVATNVSLGGRSYDVWWSPSSGGGGYVVFYANTTFTSGTVDLLQIFNYAASHSWLGTNPTVGQLSFGIEVCSTNGQTATWTINDYSITTSP
jgi:hypothetical protein